MTKKKIIAAAAIFLGIILLAAGIFFISTLSDIPEDKPLQEEDEARSLVYSDNAALFESVTVTNENGSYTLIKNEKGNVVISGRENITLLPASSKAMFEALASVYSVKTISEESTDGFGFDSPSAVISCRKTDGSEAVLYVGDAAPNTNGCRYMTLSGENKVYLLDKDRSERYMSKQSLLYSKTVSKYFDTEDMVSVSITGRNGDDIFVRPSNESEENDIRFISGFTLEKPFITGADSSTVISLCETLASLPQAEIAEDEVTEEKLREYGIADGVTVTVVADYDTSSMTLDSGEVNPYYDASNQSGKIRLTTVYKIGNTSENRIYFTYDDVPIIYSLAKSAMDFINTDTYQYCQRLVNIAYLTDISVLTVDTADGGVHRFIIQTETDDEGNKDVSSVSMDRVGISVDNFKNFYLNIVSVSHNNIGEMPQNADSVLKLTYEYSSGKTETVEFFRLPDDSRKAFMAIDGEGHFIVLMTKVDKIKSDLQKLINGEEIITN